MRSTTHSGGSCFSMASDMYGPSLPRGQDPNTYGTRHVSSMPGGFFFFLVRKPYMSANLANDSNTQQTDKGNL